MKICDIHIWVFTNGIGFYWTNELILNFSLKKTEEFSSKLKKTENQYKILKIEKMNKSFPELGGNSHIF